MKPQTFSQHRVLEALAKYKYLTVSQMVTLGIATRRNNLNTVMKPLKEGKHATIGYKDHMASTLKEGRLQYHRLEYVYYLTSYGKKYLLEDHERDEDSILIPSSTQNVYKSDYHHRKFVIDCQIAFDLASDNDQKSILRFDRYFDKVSSGKKLYAKTRVELGEIALIPDAVFIQNREEQRNLLCLEVERGTNSKKLLDKLLVYAQLMAEGVISMAYNHKKDNRVLIVVEEESLLLNTIERIKQHEDFETFFATFVEHHFLFNTLAGVLSGNPFIGWKNGRGEQYN